MEWQWTPYTVPVLAAAVLSAALSFLAWRRRPSAGAASVALLMAAVTWWSLGYGLELSGATLGWELFWSKVQYLGIVLIPVAWLVFAVEYSGWKRFLVRRYLAILAIEPLLLVVLVWTNSAHHLVWRTVDLVDAGGFSILSRTYGAAFWFHTVYSYVLLLLGAVLLVGALLRSPRLYRGQFVAVLAAAAVPWVGNVLYIVGLNPFDGLDFAPFAFTLSGLCLVFGLYRYRFLDLVPVARDVLIEEMSDGVVVLDTQSRVVDINPAAQRLLGQRSDDVVGKPMGATFASVPEADRSRMATTLDDLGLELTVGPDRRQVELRVRFLGRRKTRQGGRLIILRDVTEVRRMENERRLLDARVQRTQKLESLGALAGGVANDFNNLLMGILGYADVALSDLSPDAPAWDSVRQIELSAQQAAHLVRQMLAYSGEGDPAKESVDLSTLVEEMSMLLELSAPKGTGFTYRFSDSLPGVEADPAQIRQVVMNLIMQATRSLRDDGGSIEVETGLVDADRAYLASSYLDDNLPAGRYAYVQVADTGPGLDEETRARMFDPFFGLEGEELGFGSAATLGIVRAHGGAVRVESRPGGGAVIRVLLPCSPRAAIQARMDADRGGARTSGVILVADDERTVRAVTKRMLQQAGYRVLTAADGVEAVELFERYVDEIDAVILDATMPRMSGERALSEIHRLRAHVPAVVMSGYPEEHAANRFSGLHLAGFLQKPYRAVDLLAKLEKALERAPA